MKSDQNENVYVRVKDIAGNDFVCPLNELRDPRSISAAESEYCFEGDVVGRYAGMLNIVDLEEIQGLSIRPKAFSPSINR